MSISYISFMANECGATMLVVVCCFNATLELIWLKHASDMPLQAALLGVWLAAWPGPAWLVAAPLAFDTRRFMATSRLATTTSAGNGDKQLIQTQRRNCNPKRNPHTMNAVSVSDFVYILYCIVCNKVKSHVYLITKSTCNLSHNKSKNKQRELGWIAQCVPSWVIKSCRIAAS